MKSVNARFEEGAVTYKQLFRCLVSVLLATSPVLSNAAGNGNVVQQPLREDSLIDVCDDVAEFPPYTYYKREGARKTDTVAGMTYDIAAAILARHKLKFRVQLVPWKRCEEGVKVGMYAMALNGSLNAERAAALYMVGPHAERRNYYFYSREHHPAGLDIRDMADLRKYRVCGVYGYNYEAPYDLPVGFMDKGALDYESLVTKVLVNRCDLFLEGLEIMQGFKLVGRPFMDDPRLTGKPMPLAGNPTASFYFMVSRKHPLGRALADLFTRELEQMKKSGELKSIRERYLHPAK
jgi:polar amino acid transport system substrate-binding protein